MISHLEAGEQGKPGVSFSPNRRPENQGRQCPGQEKADVLAQAESRFALPPPFCASQSLHGFGDGYLHW